METQTLENTIIQDVKRRLFYGSPSTPFLAPRGISFTGEKLLVSDTGQNRVFIWNQLPEGEKADPDVILGQEQLEGTGRNAGETASASSLQYPSGIWTDGKRLVVADAWNHRVLIWHQFPTENAQPADVVLGQADFTGNQPNREGVNAPTGADTLYWPYGVTSDGESLWVADTGNRRVLYFAQIPQKNGTPANKVIGQPTFENRDYDPDHAIWPYSVKLGQNGELAIVDTSYYRVLLWKCRENAFRSSAELVLGQPDLKANGQNQHSFFPKATTLNWCYDAVFADQGLWVADTGNSRLLRWENWPGTNAQAADTVLGQTDFVSGSENMNSINSKPDSLYWPFSLSLNGGCLAAADTGNHRVVFHEWVQ